MPGSASATLLHVLWYLSRTSHLDEFAFIERVFWASNIYHNLSHEETHEGTQHKDKFQRTGEKNLHSGNFIADYKVNRVKSV